MTPIIVYIFKVLSVDHQFNLPYLNDTKEKNQSITFTDVGSVYDRFYHPLMTLSEHYIQNIILSIDSIFTRNLQVIYIYMTSSLRVRRSLEYGKNRF